MDTINPNLWYVCKFCLRAYQLKENLINHKKQNHVLKLKQERKLKKQTKKRRNKDDNISDDLHLITSSTNSEACKSNSGVNIDQLKNTNIELIAIETENLTIDEVDTDPSVLLGARLRTGSGCEQEPDLSKNTTHSSTISDDLQLDPDSSPLPLPLLLSLPPETNSNSSGEESSKSPSNEDVDVQHHASNGTTEESVALNANRSSNDQDSAVDLDTYSFNTSKSRRSSCATVESGISSVFSENNEVDSAATTEESDVDMDVNNTGNSNNHEYIEDKVVETETDTLPSTSTSAVLISESDAIHSCNSNNQSSSLGNTEGVCEMEHISGIGIHEKILNISSQNSGPAKDIYVQIKTTNEISLATVVANLKRRLIPPVLVPDPDLLSRNNSRLSGTAADGNIDSPELEITENLTDQQNLTVFAVPKNISVGRTEVENDPSPCSFGLGDLSEKNTDKDVSNLDTDPSENEPSLIVPESCSAPTFGSSKSPSFELETFESLKSQSKSGSVGLIPPDSAPRSDTPTDAFGSNPSFLCLRESVAAPSVSRPQSVQRKPRPKPYGNRKNKESHVVETTETGKSNNVNTSSKTELQAVAALASTISSAYLMLSATNIIPPTPAAITVETVAEGASLTASLFYSGQPEESVPSFTPANTVEDVGNGENPGAIVTSGDILTNATNIIETEDTVTNKTAISLGVHASVNSIFQTSSFKAKPPALDQFCIFGGDESAGLREDLQTETRATKNRSQVTVEEHTGKGEDISTNGNSRPEISTSTAATHIVNNNGSSSVLSTYKNKQPSLSSPCLACEDVASSNNSTAAIISQSAQTNLKIEEVDDTQSVPVPLLRRVREIEVIDLVDDTTDEEVEEEQTVGKIIQKEVGKVPESKSSKSPAPVKSLNANQSTETDEYAELRSRIARNRKRKQMENPGTHHGRSSNSEVETNPSLVSLGDSNTDTDQQETEKHGNKRQKKTFDPVPSIGLKCIHCTSTCKSAKTYRKHIRKVHGLDPAQNRPLTGTGTPSLSKDTEDQGQDADINMDIEVETAISSDTATMSVEETNRKNTEDSVAVEQVEVQSELFDPNPTACASVHEPPQQISISVADVRFPDTSNNTIRSDGGTDFTNNSEADPSVEKDVLSGPSAEERIETATEESTNTNGNETANQVVVDICTTTETDIPMETESVTDPKTKSTPTLGKGIRVDIGKPTETDECPDSISNVKKFGTKLSKNATNISSLIFGNNGLCGISSLKKSNLVKQHSSAPPNSNTFSESDSTITVTKLAVAQNAVGSGVNLDCEIEVLPPPPPKIAEVIDLLEDSDEDERNQSNQEIVQEKQHVPSSPTGEKKELIGIQCSPTLQSQNQIQHKVKAIHTNRIESIPQNAAKLKALPEEVRKNEATVKNRTETNRINQATVAKRTETNRRNEATVANRTERNRKTEATTPKGAKTNRKTEATVTNSAETKRRNEASVANRTGTNRRNEDTMRKISQSNLKNKERTENNRNDRKRSQESQRQRSQSRSRFQNFDERGQKFYEDYDFDFNYNDTRRHSTPGYTPSNIDLSRVTCIVCGFVAQSRKLLFQHLESEGHRRQVPRQCEGQEPGVAQVSDARIRIQYRRNGGDDPREPQTHDRLQQRIYDRREEQIRDPRQQTNDRRQQQFDDRRQQQIDDRRQQEFDDRRQQEFDDRRQQEFDDRHQQEFDDRRQQEIHDPRQEQNQPQRFLYCTVCDFCATSAGQIDRHQKQVHVGEALMYRCSVCDFQNWGRTSVKEHVYLVHKVGNYINPTARCISYNIGWV